MARPRPDDTPYRGRSVVKAGLLLPPLLGTHPATTGVVVLDDINGSFMIVAERRGLLSARDI
jgi:hypothetical protein